MSYANATVSPAARVKAASGVIAIHALLGAGVVLGLAATGIIETPRTIIETFDVRDELDPPPPPPTPEPAQPTSERSVITAPDPVIPIPIDRSVPAEPVQLDMSDNVVLRPIGNIDVPGPAVPQPPARPLFDPVGPTPANAANRWITNNDYPRVGITRELEGTVSYRLVVGSNGRVENCEIARSSGHDVLDREACRLLERRARFNPAKNNRGEEVVGTFTGSVTWQIPD